MTMRLEYIRSEYLMQRYPTVYKEITEAVATNRPIYTLKRCLAAVCQHYGVKPEDIAAPTRKQTNVIPRHHFCWVVFTHRLDLSYARIAEFLNRDHTTVMHGVRKFAVEKHLKTADIEAVERIIHDTFQKAEGARAASAPVGVAAVG